MYNERFDLIIQFEFLLFNAQNVFNLPLCLYLKLIKLLPVARGMEGTVGLDTDIFKTTDREKSHEVKDLSVVNRTIVKSSPGSVNNKSYLNLYLCS